MIPAPLIPHSKRRPRFIGWAGWLSLSLAATLLVACEPAKPKLTSSDPKERVRAVEAAALDTAALQRLLEKEYDQSVLLALCKKIQEPRLLEKTLLVLDGDFYKQCLATVNDPEVLARLALAEGVQHVMHRSLAFEKLDERSRLARVAIRTTDGRLRRQALDKFQIAKPAAVNDSEDQQDVEMVQRALAVVSSPQAGVSPPDRARWGAVTLNLLRAFCDPVAAAEVGAVKSMEIKWKELTQNYYLTGTSILAETWRGEEVALTLRLERRPPFVVTWRTHFEEYEEKSSSDMTRFKHAGPSVAQVLQKAGLSQAAIAQIALHVRDDDVTPGVIQLVTDQGQLHALALAEVHDPVMMEPPHQNGSGTSSVAFVSEVLKQMNDPQLVAQLVEVFEAGFPAGGTHDLAYRDSAAARLLQLQNSHGQGAESRPVNAKQN